MWNTSISSKHWPEWQCLLEHPQRGLEASSNNKQHCLWAAVLVPGAQSWGSIEQGGSWGTHKQPTFVRTECSEGDARWADWWHVFCPVLEVIAVRITILDGRLKYNILTTHFKAIYIIYIVNVLSIIINKALFFILAENLNDYSWKMLNI